MPRTVDEFLQDILINNAAIGNRLRHGYFAIDSSIVWQTITIDLPVLRQTVLNIQTKLAGGK